NYHSEESFVSMFEDHSAKELWNFFRAGIGVGFSIPLIPFGVGLSLLWGAYLIRLQDLGAPSLVLFSGFVFLFLEPLMFLSWVGVVFTASMASWARIRELINEISHQSLEEVKLQKLNQQTKGHVLTADFWGTPLKVSIRP